MIDAVFNHRNFWDGRANNVFNGLNPLGERGLLATPENPRPGTLVRGEDGVVRKVQVRIDNASLASQAVGPPLSDFEMSCSNRTWADLGRKLRTRAPLALQRVHPEDSVLGSLRGGRGLGLRGTYQSLLQQAFHEKWWAGGGSFSATGDQVAAGAGYSQMEVNFPLFFGLAVQLYEATLVSGQTPFDHYMQGDDTALDAVEQFGLEVFVESGRCASCHAGPELTGASVRLRAGAPLGEGQAIERMAIGDGGGALYDGGFYNIGVRPTFEDLGIGADLGGYPLAFSRQAASGAQIDAFAVASEHLELPGPVVRGERLAVDGAFKVPSLRNIALTGPYFHNGGQATLAQVVEFYDRGGDRVGVGSCDTSGFAENCSNLDADIVPLGLSAVTRTIDGRQVTEAEALVRFLAALTDERVRYERAPFDHPELVIPHGHPGSELSITTRVKGRAADSLMVIPAVGRNGSTEALRTFLGLDPSAP
jgi:cytochrome c peroxidase